MKSSRLFLGVICIICLAACRKEKPLSPIPDSLAGFKELFNPAYQISAIVFGSSFMPVWKKINRLQFGILR